MKKLFPWLLLTPFIFLLLQCESGDQRVVARIGDEKITVKEFRQSLQNDYRGKNLAELTPEEKQKTLERMLDERRKIMWAEEKGLDKDPAYLAEYNANRNRSLAIALYNKIVIDQVAPEAILKEYYEWKYQKLDAVVVYIGHQNSRAIRNDRSEEEAEKLAAEYREKLAVSADPQKTAEEITDNKRTPVMLKPYTLGRFDTGIDRVMFNASAGEVVGPLKSENYGLLIFKVLDKQSLPKTADFAASKGELQQVLRGQNRQQEKELFDKYSEEFKQKYGAEVFDEQINSFLAQLKAWGEKPEHQISDFTKEQRETMLAKIGDQSVTVDDLINFFQGRLISDYRKFQTVDDLKNGYVLPQVNLLAWGEEGEKRGYHKDENVKESLEKFKIQRLSRFLEDELAAEGGEASEEEILAYYKENRDKYLLPERIQVWQIPVQDEKTARLVIQKAKSGTAFDQLNKQYAIKPKGAPNRYDLGFQNRNSKFAAVVEKAFAAGANQVAGPVVEEGTYYVIKTGEYHAESVKPLEEVRSSINATLINERKNEKREALLGELRKKYSYRINESNMRSVS